MIRWWRGHRILRAVLLTGLLCVVLIQIKSSQNDKGYFSSDVSVHDANGRRLFGDVSNDTAVDVWTLPRKDKRLLSKIKWMIQKPEQGDYNLTNPDFTDFSRGQSVQIDNILQGKKRGFFIEIGASDGEIGSVSLFFEKSRGWEGLLIEPHPGRYRELRHKHRKAQTLRACVRSNSSRPNREFDDVIEGHVTVPCLWMESILEAMGRETVDVLSIDARDQEMDILKAIPLSEYYVNVLTVEFVEGSMSDSAVLRYLLDHGYHAEHQFVNHPLHRNDLIFTRKKHK